MKGWGMKLTAVVVALAFMVGFSGMLTGHAYAQEKGAAAAGKAGAEAGAATAAGISTGTIVAGVIAAAAIAAIAAASGGGGGAVSVPTTPSSVASSLAKAGLSPSDMLGLYDALSDSTFQSILSEISYEDLVTALQKKGVLSAGKDELPNWLKLKNWLDQLESNNPDLYNRVVNVLKKLAENKTLFEQVQAMVKDPQEFMSAVLKQVETLLTQQHQGYTVTFTHVHLGGGVKITQYHLKKQ